MHQSWKSLSRGLRRNAFLDVSLGLLGLTEEKFDVANFRVRGSQISIEVQRRYHRNHFALSKPLETGRVSVRHAPVGRKLDNKLAGQGRSFEGGALCKLGITAHVLASWITRIENYRDFADKPS